MIIGVDVGALSITDDRLKAGVYRTTYNILFHLSKIDKSNSYRLYSFLPLPRKVMTTFGSNMKNIVLKPSLGWQSVRLPIELSTNKVDVFLGLSQAIPKTSTRSIVFVYDFGFFQFPEYYGQSYKKLMRNTDNAVKQASKILAISKSTKQELLDRYQINRRKVAVCYLGVANHFTKTGKKYKHSKPYFLYVGSLKRTKNIPTIIRGFAYYLDKVNKATDLLLVGSNYWMDSQIEETIKRFKLQKRVKILTTVSDTVLASMYRSAISYMSPSITEGFCLPAIEAMACGCPVIASSHPVFKEIVKDAGILVNANNELEITRAMKQISTSKVKQKKMKAKGVTRSKQYTWKKAASCVLAEIEKVTKNSRET